MKFVTALHTDIGIKKKTNQDSALIIEAKTQYGNILFACICDGMGGLAKGEVASAALVKQYSEWFANKLPAIIYSEHSSEDIKESMNNVLYDMSVKIMDYGRECGVNLGTTAVALLIFGDKYYISTVGDSRAYMITDGFYQLTKDQTYVQREIDLGRMTPEEAKTHPQRNVLLQCIGASDFIIPDFYEGNVIDNAEFMLCSDGFRHLIAEEEFYNRLSADKVPDSSSMKQALVELTELNKQRREDDNITALMIRVVPD